MPVAGGGFEQCYNAQAAVTVIATDVVQAANDKQQLEPMLGQLAALPADLGRPQTLLGDNGYFSAANDPSGVGTARETIEEAGRGARQDRGARPRALGPRAGRI
jgi:hypothetical protein